MNVTLTSRIARVKRRKRLELRNEGNHLKKTVGIILPSKLMAEARKRNLNITRITEQALTGIVKYLHLENESSKFLSAVLF